MDQHLTLSEARQFTGKSESTLKRLLREITSDPQHLERPFILPTPDEVERRRAAKEPYVWKIDRQLLLRRFPLDEGGIPERGADAASSATGTPDLVIQVLREQLSSKDEQIRMLATQLDRKDEQLAAQNERMRESNVLMRELQQRLALAPPMSAPVDVETQAASETPSSPSPIKSPTKKTPSPKPAKRRGLFGLFRSAKPANRGK